MAAERKSDDVRRMEIEVEGWDWGVLKVGPKSWYYQYKKANQGREFEESTLAVAMNGIFLAFASD